MAKFTPEEARELFGLYKTAEKALEAIKLHPGLTALDRQIVDGTLRELTVGLGRPMKRWTGIKE
jgi:hypothetical protein